MQYTGTRNQEVDMNVAIRHGTMGLRWVKTKGRGSRAELFLLKVASVR